MQSYKWYKAHGTDPQSVLSSSQISVSTFLVAMFKWILALRVLELGKADGISVWILRLFIRRVCKRTRMCSVLYIGSKLNVNWEFEQQLLSCTHIIKDIHKTVLVLVQA